MHIQSYTTQPYLFQGIGAFIGACAITGIALGIIGLLATPSGPFNVIVQWGTTAHQILLSASIFVSILDLAALSWLCKRPKPTEESEILREERIVIEESEKLETHSGQSVVLPTEFPKRPIIKVKDYEENTKDAFAHLSDEVLLQILSYFTPSELATLSTISTRWFSVSADISLWSIRVLGPEQWKAKVDLAKYGLSVDDAPPLNMDAVHSFLRKVLLAFPVKGNAGVTLLTIPKGLAFKNIREFAFDEIREATDCYLDDQHPPASSTYHVVMLNGSIPEGTKHKKIIQRKGGFFLGTALIVANLKFANVRVLSEACWPVWCKTLEYRQESAPKTNE